MRARTAPGVILVAMVASCGGSAPPPAARPCCAVGPGAHAEVSAHAAIDVDVEADGAIADDDVRAVVFVLDHSGSMRTDEPSWDPPEGIGAVPVPGRDLDVDEWFPSARWGRAQKVVIMSLRSLPDGATVGLVDFGDTVTSRGPVVLDPTTRAELERAVLATVPFGGTTLTDALRAAYALAIPRIVIVSDATVHDAGGPRQLLREARAQIARAVQFDTVQIDARSHGDLLELLADESGGSAMRLP